MGYEASRKKIATYIGTNWGVTYPMFSENQGETQPTAPFGRFSIRPISATSLQIGASTAVGRRSESFLWFQFFGQEGKGNADAMKFADEVITLFDQKVMVNDDGERMIFRRSELSYVGMEPSGRPMWRVTVPFSVDDL